MLVIYGMKGKSRKLEEILKERNTNKKNTLILDTVGIQGLYELGDCYKMRDILDVVRFLHDYTQMSKPFGVKIDRENLKYIVLEINCSRKMIETFQRLEVIVGKEFIITVQCPCNESQNGIQVYEV